MSARAELLALYRRDGFVTPESVVKAATPKSSPLHDYFTWDDSEAARRYRLVEAQGLIRRYKITVEVAPERTVRLRAFSAIPGTGYVSTPDGLAQQETRDVIFQQAVRELSALRRKYDALVDVDAAWQAASNGSRRRKRAS